jgi:hypothetical protein
MAEGSGRSFGLTEVLSQCLPAGTRENHESGQPVSCVCHLNPALPKYESKSITARPTHYSVIESHNPDNPFCVLWQKNYTHTPEKLHLLWQRTLNVPHQHDVRDDKMILHKDIYASYEFKHIVFLWTNVI